jgi:pyridoxal 5'-phosphate synthase pdxT subunit
VNIGVLSLQGAAAPHVAMLARLGVPATAVRTPSEFGGVDALVLPGGESTTMSMLLDSAGLTDTLADRLADGLPVFGTCAGMILLAGKVLDGRDDQRSFGVLDIDVRRNGYGRQVDSFEADLEVPALADDAGDRPFHAVFIRAPLAERVGPAVEVLAEVGGRAVLCRQGPVLVASFHPELSDDPRIHEFFLSEVI